MTKSPDNTCKISAEFSLARDAYKAGRLAEAEALYRSIPEQRANHAEVIHLFGRLMAGTGRAGNGAAQIGA